MSPTHRRSAALLWIAAATWLCMLGPAAPASAQTTAIPLVWFLGFNTTLPPFNDVLARQAVAAAIDRTKLAQAGVKPEELGELGVWVLSTFAGSAVGQEEVDINNRDMDSLIERARSAGDFQVKAQLYREAQ